MTPYLWAGQSNLACAAWSAVVSGQIGGGGGGGIGASYRRGGSDSETESESDSESESGCYIVDEGEWVGRSESLHERAVDAENFCGKRGRGEDDRTLCYGGFEGDCVQVGKRAKVCGGDGEVALGEEARVEEVALKRGRDGCQDALQKRKRAKVSSRGLLDLREKVASREIYGRAGDGLVVHEDAKEGNERGADSALEATHRRYDSAICGKEGKVGSDAELEAGENGLVAHLSDLKLLEGGEKPGNDVTKCLSSTIVVRA